MSESTSLKIRKKEECKWDLVSLGEVMLRLDPGDVRVATTRQFQVWEGGGEYNVARGLRRCFGLKTAIVTALADNPVGRLVEDLMNQGVLLWKTGKLKDAGEWMRQARKKVPNNQRILFNAAQILVSHLQQHGYDASLSAEAYEVLHYVDRLLPGQQRFAQLMEQLAQLQPAAESATITEVA